MSKFPTAAEMRAWGDEQTDPEIKAVFYRVADDFDQKGWARVADAYYLTEATTHKLETDAAIRIAEMAHMVGWEAIFEGKVTERDDKLEPIFGQKKLDTFKMTKAINSHLK